MKNFKVITESDIHQDDLIIKDGKLGINPERLKAVATELGTTVTDYTLEVPNPNAVQIIQDANTNARKNVSINGLGMGVISLDFICRVNGNRTVAFRAPEGCPLPKQTITTNAGSGLLWWNKGSREIIFSQIQNNQRVVLNLIGYFE